MAAKKGVAKGLVQGADGKLRCAWYGSQDDYQEYHDNEWGNPVDDDDKLFEKICLEGFQAGLSWLTILRKRENFREAFDHFEIERVARFTQRDVNRLLKNAGIVRHRQKIESTINNAKHAMALRDEFGSLGSWFWQYEPAPSDRPRKMTHAALSAITQSEQSLAMSKALKKQGWSFVGPTTAYAFMQAMGIVNDHLEGCICREKITRLRKAFTRPSI